MEPTEQQICGYKIRFPMKPYPPQLALMSKLLSTLDASLHTPISANALLESPTGTGKTLALLCSALSWQQEMKRNPARLSPHCQSTATLDAIDPLAFGGGFIADEGGTEKGTVAPGGEARCDSSREAVGEVGNNPTEPLDKVVVKEKKKTKKGVEADRQTTELQEKKKIPRIYYATRTHSQISQVVRELKRTGYQPSMAILAARKHYCCNATVRKKASIDDECRSLLSGDYPACAYFRSYHKLCPPSSSSSTCTPAVPVHDVEDLVKLGQKVKGCPYFAARSLATRADIVLCPYSYLLDPVVRRSVDLSLDGAVLIFDEAHNIEEVCREAASFDASVEELKDVAMELQQIASLPLQHRRQLTAATGGKQNKSLAEDVDVAGEDGVAAADSIVPLADAMTALSDWLMAHPFVQSLLQSQSPSAGGPQKRRQQMKDDSKHAVLEGPSILSALSCAGFPLIHFALLQRCAKQVVAAARREEPPSAFMSARSAGVLDGIFSTLSFMLNNNCHSLSDFRLVLHRASPTHFTTPPPSLAPHRAKGAASASRAPLAASSGARFALWCLNPAVAFRPLAMACRSIVLTSGTLSPMDSFASELGVPFITRLEGHHVIDTSKQLWAGVIPRGRLPVSLPLNASFAHSSSVDFQDEVAAVLESICRITPGGVLLFLPSFHLLTSLTRRWQASGAWSRLAAIKALFTEPRGSEDRIEDVLLRFKQAVRGEAAAAGGADADEGAGKDTSVRRQRGKNNKFATPRQAECTPDRNEEELCDAGGRQGGTGKAGKRKGVVRKYERGTKRRKENEPLEEGRLLDQPPAANSVKAIAGDRIVGQELNLAVGADRQVKTEISKVGCESATADDAWAQIEAFRQVCEAGGEWEEESCKDVSGKEPPVLHGLPGGNEDQRLNGALMLAVCRGKVSEGIDFADEFARVVVVVGIPYPNITSLQVRLKKQYNDRRAAASARAAASPPSHISTGGASEWLDPHRSDAPHTPTVPPPVCLSGDAWYRQSAFRAMNQAAGRCIRHVADYGAVVLLDERMASVGLQGQLSRWMRPRLTVHGNADVALQSLEGFFTDKSGGKREGLNSAELDSGDGCVSIAAAGRPLGSSGTAEKVCKEEPCMDKQGDRCCKRRTNARGSPAAGSKVRMQAKHQLVSGRQLTAPSVISCKEGPTSRCCQEDGQLRSPEDAEGGVSRHDGGDGAVQSTPFSQCKTRSGQQEKMARSVKETHVDVDYEALESRRPDHVAAAGFMETQMSPLTPHLHPLPNVGPTAKVSPPPHLHMLNQCPTNICLTNVSPLTMITPSVDSEGINLDATPIASQARRRSSSMLRNWEGRSLTLQLNKLLQGDDISTGSSE